MENIQTRKAFLFAKEAHGEQMYGDKPYTHHLLAVVRVLIDCGYTDDLYIDAGLLHDTDEDTDATVEQIEMEFDMMTARIVWACTGIGPNRKARNQMIYTNLGVVPEAAPVKAADRIANMESAKVWQPRLFAMYQKEHPAFIEAVKDNINPAMLERLVNAAA